MPNFEALKEAVNRIAYVLPVNSSLVFNGINVGAAVRTGPQTAQDAITALGLISAACPGVVEFDGLDIGATARAALAAE